MEAPRIVSIVYNISCLGWHLIDARKCDHVMEEAMVSIDQAHTDETLTMLEQCRESSESDDLDAPRCEEKMMECELLYLGGGTDDAKWVFQQAREQAPDDPEIRNGPKPPRYRPTWQMAARPCRDIYKRFRYRRR